MADTLPLYIQLGLVEHGSKVRAKLDEVADRIEARGKELADADDQPEFGREDGVRPGDHAKSGAPRPYARVSIDSAREFGSATVIRQRLLGQAVDEINAAGPKL